LITRSQAYSQEDHRGREDYIEANCCCQALRQRDDGCKALNLGTLSDTTHSTDICNINSEGEVFEITVRETKNSLRKYDIGGKARNLYPSTTSVKHTSPPALWTAPKVNELEMRFLQYKVEAV
jgi:hypothetical protein